jgi:hypothetical protein
VGDFGYVFLDMLLVVLKMGRKKGIFMGVW